MHHPSQVDTYHGPCYTRCGALAGTRNSSIVPPWSDDRSYHERTLLPRSYISLCWGGSLVIIVYRVMLYGSPTLEFVFGHFLFGPFCLFFFGFFNFYWGGGGGHCLRSLIKSIYIFFQKGPRNTSLFHNSTFCTSIFLKCLSTLIYY